MTSARPALREDVFVSLCFPEAPASAADVAAIAEAGRQIAATFRYFEVLVIARIEDPDDFLAPCLQDVAHTRILRVRGSGRHYARRVAAASEAIGDVVVLTALGEAGALDLSGMAAAAVEQNAVMVCTRAGGGGNNPLLRALGAAARFRISSGDLRTLAIPRVWLNRLLAHPQCNLALRFPPLGQGLPIRHLPVDGLPALSADEPALRHRVGLLYQLAVNAAPAVLIGVGLLSCAVTAGALAVIVYAIGVVLLATHVQEGWFTTTLVQAGTAGYLGLAILGLSMGLQKLLERAEPRIDDTVVDEIGNGDLFAGMQDLNVAVDIGRPGPAGRPAAPDASGAPPPAPAGPPS